MVRAYGNTTYSLIATYVTAKKKLKRALVFFFFVAIAFLRVEEYIVQGKDSFLMDPGPNSLYKNRNFAKQGASCVVVDSNCGEVS